MERDLATSFSTRRFACGATVGSARPCTQRDFLLLAPSQAAYAEICMLDTLWPDFGERELAEALNFYSSRTRTFGKRIDGTVST